MALTRLRGRLPVVAFVLLVLVCLVLIGLVCACFGETPLQALDRAFAAGFPLAAVVELWPLLAAVLLAVVFGGVVAVPVRAAVRASPAVLQRFLF